MADDLKLKYEVNLTKTGDGAAAAAKELQAVGTAGEKAGQSLAGMGREFKTAMAAVVGAAIIRESIQAFTEQDAAARRLTGTLAALGKNSGDTARQMQALAQSVVLPPGATRNSVLDAIAELTRNGASTSELPKLTQQVLDLAAAGYSVDRAADAMGNAVAGDFGKLSKILNVDFPAGAGRAKNLADALQLIEQRFGGLAASAAGGLGGGLSDFNENLTKIKASLGEIILTGLQPMVRELSAAASFWAELINGQPPAPYVRPAWAPGGPLKGPAAATGPDLARNYDPALAAKQLADLQREAQLRLLRNEVPLVRPPSTVNVSGANVMQERRPVNALLREEGAQQLETLQQQLAGGTIKAHEFDEALKAITFQLEVNLAQGAAAGYAALQQTHRAQMGDAAARMDTITEEFAQRRRSIDDYVNGAALQAQTDRERAYLIREQAVAMGELAQQERVALFAATELGQGLQQVGRQGVEAFASGISNTLVSAFRTGRLEFKAFAAEFLGQIAQMIMQMIILATIKRALAGSSLGGFLGFAEGGFAPRMAAAGAIAGTQTVNSATYFPQFNTVAGEAGGEVLAVLSRPRFMEIGGLASYVGSVQGQRVAMTNADDLARSAGGRGGAGGTIVVEVRGTRDFEARVIDSSIEGAVVRVVNDLHQDGPMSNAVKGLTS